MKPELIKFVAGTKAKASEINENFDKLLNYVVETEENDVRVYKPDQEFEYGKYVLGEVDGIFGIYKSVAEENKGNPLTDENYWVKVDLLEEFDLGYYLNKSQITNCLLEVPQTVKYSLVDGVLTMLAGTKGIIPNGSGVFDEINYTSDKPLSVGSVSGDYYVLPTASGSWIFSASNSAVSGATDTGSGNYRVWYDTANNIVKYFQTSTDTYTQVGLPVMKVTRTNGYVTAILEVFNGFGFIGSTVWVDKGVKVLAPNGRNTDGTLNNRESITNTVKLMHTGWNNGLEYCSLNHNGTFQPARYFVAQDEKPNLTGAIWYNTRENIVYRITSSGVMSRATEVVVCTCNREEDGKVTALEQKQPFRAVDYNDFAKVQNTAIGYPDYTKGITKSWDTEYTADVDGWVTASAWIIDAGPEASLVINGVNLVVSTITGGTVTRGDKKLYPIKKGWTYKATGGNSNKSIIFYPCI